MTSLSYRDAGWGGTRAFVLLGAILGITNTVGSVTFAQTIIIPTLSVSEMYDSNVFFTPKSLLSPGSKPEDFVTTMTPQINMAHTGSLIRGSLSVGALVTKYIKNPDLDYTGINAGGNLDLTQWGKSMSQRVMRLSVTGMYTLTPSMSQFGAAGGQYGAGYGSNYGTTGLSTALNSGLVTNRVSFNNINMSISGGYQLTRTTAVTGTYNYTTIFFGNQNGAENQLFDTTGHTGTITINTLLTPRDTVGTTATISHYIQGQSNGSGEGSFTTPSGQVNWSRRWTQQLNTTLSGGAMLILPIESTVPGQSQKTQVAPTTTVSINYRSFSEALRDVGSGLGAESSGLGAAAFAQGPFYGLPSMFGSLSPGGIVQPGQYTASFTYNYSYYPSFAYSAGATKSHVVGANVSGGITSQLTGQVGMNFGHGSSVASSTSFTYDTVGVTIGARYLLGPILASLTSNWLYFANSSSQSFGGSGDTAFSKKTILLALSYAFTSQSFFKMDKFGFAGSSGSGEGTSVPSGQGEGNVPSNFGPRN